MRARVEKEWELRSQQKCAVVSGGFSGAAHISLKKAFAVCEEFSKSHYQHKDDIYLASFHPC